MSLDFTRWSILGSGEGGTRISGQYLAVTEHPVVGERVLMINSNRADLRNVLEEMRERMPDRFNEERMDHIVREHTVAFGESRGAGNYFIRGEEHAMRHFKDLIRRRLVKLQIGQGDALVTVTTLGGGTGNGSVPFIIRSLKEGGGLDGVYHVTVATWPFETEEPHQRFNAVAGLSRLLVDEETGRQNTDFLLLADNTRLRRLAGLAGEGGRDPYYHRINEMVIQAIDLLTAGGRRAVNVIDVEDLVRIPNQLGLYHFTAGIAVDVPEEAMLEFALDRALENTFYDLDPKTVLVAFAYVRVPRRLLGRHEFTQDGVREGVYSWAKGRLNLVQGMTSLCIGDDAQEGFDVLLLLGGFDLKPGLEQGLEDYDRMTRALSVGEGRTHKHRFERIRQRLTDYLDVVDRAQEAAR